MGLRLNGLTKSFDKKTLFRDFSYEFGDTGIYAVTGASGTGKTTLLRLVAGLDKEFEGEIAGGGIKSCSICFQEHRLFPHLTAVQNVTAVSFHEETVENTLAAKALLRRLNFTDDDMQLYPAELSGGMRQRVAFARAVLRKSSILILDEATKELDASLVDTVLDIIKEEGEKRLVLLVTHKDTEIERLGADIINLS